MKGYKGNINIFGRPGFSAYVHGSDGSKAITWGFDVSERHGKAFTAELANQILDFANTEYKKKCPDGYFEKAYDPSLDFTYVRYDMTDYRYNGITMIPVGDRLEGIYRRDKNRLRIYKDGEPIYENNNGIICRDTVAMMDG